MKLLGLLYFLIFWFFLAAGNNASAAPAATAVDAEMQAVQHLENMISRINMFHHEARSSIVSALGISAFTDYFQLEESATNRRNEMGKLVLSEFQDRTRTRMEEWSDRLYKRFPIGEICVVDRFGQEHMRFANGRVELPVAFSDTEHGSPFFLPTFEINKGEVFLSEPYMSADLHQWVIAFTSPIILENGVKPGFLHFEIPLSFYQTLITTKNPDFYFNNVVDKDKDEEGRYFIVTRDGYLLGDSRGTIDFDMKAGRHPEKNPILPGYWPTERLEEYAGRFSDTHQDREYLTILERIKEQERGIIQITLDNVPYVAAFEKIPDRSWWLVHLDPVGNKGFWEK